MQREDDRRKVKGEPEEAQPPSPVSTQVHGSHCRRVRRGLLRGSAAGHLLPVSSSHCPGILATSGGR